MQNTPHDDRINAMAGHLVAPERLAILRQITRTRSVGLAAPMLPRFSMPSLRRLTVVTTLLIAASSLAAEPQRDGRLLELALPPGPGDRFVSAEFACWLPEGATPVRAVIIHQHGCTNASPDKHPPVTLDAHWRALARKHRCALLVPMYQVAGNCDEWNDPDSGSERALFTALEDFGRRFGQPELSNAPWLLWGHSGGSSWSAQMIVRHPGRVLAASFRGGCRAWTRRTCRLITIRTCREARPRATPGRRPAPSPKPAGA